LWVLPLKRVDGADFCGDNGMGLRGIDADLDKDRA
jgi:hypothetical protein